MLPKVCLLIGIYGLNLCYLPGQELSWEDHAAAGGRLRAQAHYKEAEQEYLASMRAAEAFGPTDVRLAKTWTSLAGLYQERGRYDEAASLYRRAAPVYERELGPEDPNFAACLSNLAMAERWLGRHKEAEELYLRAIAILEKQPVVNPILHVVRSNLGEFYQSRGRYKEAEPLLLRALAARREVLGSNHPDLALIMGNIGALRRSEGQFREAEQVFRQGLSDKPHHEISRRREKLCLRGAGVAGIERFDYRLLLMIEPLIASKFWSARYEHADKNALFFLQFKWRAKRQRFPMFQILSRERKNYGRDNVELEMSERYVGLNRRVDVFPNMDLRRSRHSPKHRMNGRDLHPAGRLEPDQLLDLNLLAL